MPVAVDVGRTKFPEEQDGAGVCEIRLLTPAAATRRFASRDRRRDGERKFLRLQIG